VTKEEKKANRSRALKIALDNSKEAKVEDLAKA